MQISLQTFVEFTFKMAGNTRKTIWRPDSARIRCGSLQHFPADPLAAWTSRGGTGEESCDGWNGIRRGWMVKELESKRRLGEGEVPHTSRVLAIRQCCN